MCGSTKAGPTAPASLEGRHAPVPPPRAAQHPPANPARLPHLDGGASQRLLQLLACGGHEVGVEGARHSQPHSHAERVDGGGVNGWVMHC